MKKNYHIKTEVEMLEFGAKLAAEITSPQIVYLQGELGAGKTTLVRGFLRGLGYNGIVKSPTYTLVESYEAASKKIYHFDLYRLRDPEELEYIGIRDYFKQDAIFLIEWPECGFGLLPEADIVCSFAIDGSERSVVVFAMGFFNKE